VYEEDGKMGNAAPLYFTAESTCADAEGNSETCDVSKFMETSKALIKGQMTESGVEVSQLELVN
jgi:hypothetical protein